MTVQTSTSYNLRRAAPAWALLALFIVVPAAISPVFRSAANVGNVLSQFGPLGLAALAQSVAFLVAGIDLSIGAVMSLTTVILSFAGQDISPLALLPIALAAGLLFGLFNGIGITIVGIPPLLMTFGSMAIANGIALLLRNQPGGQVDTAMANFINYDIGPLAVSALIVFFLYYFVWFWLSSSRTGRAIYACGGNEANAYKAGLPVRRVKILAYVIAGLLASGAGVLLGARIYSGDPTIGGNYLLDCITAAVIGGTSLLGGQGSVLGSLAGALILVLSNNILNLFHISTYFQYVTKGVILFAALIVSFIGESRKKHGRQIVAA